MNEGQGTHRLIPGTQMPTFEASPVRAEHAELIWSWVNDDKARTWLDLGSGRQTISKRDLYLLVTSPRNHARLFHRVGGGQPLGLVCLNDARNLMGSADIWGIRGVYDRETRNAAAASFLLTIATGFLDLGRTVIGSWVCDGNSITVGMHRRLGFVETGRLRARHVVNGVAYDRLLFDLTRDEFMTRYPDVPSETGVTARSLGCLPSKVCPIRAEIQELSYAQ
jgi:RimJ/RimL family protein N-acetyltransferase